MATLYPILLAVISGVAISIQAQMMGLMDQGMGTKESVFITYLGGGVLATLAILFSKGGNLQAWPGVPWYAFTAGLFGLIIVGTIGYIVPHLGLAKGFVIVTASQFVSAVVLDQFGLLGATVRTLDANRILGLGVLMVGVWLVLRSS